MFKNFINKVLNKHVEPVIQEKTERPREIGYNMYRGRDLKEEINEKLQEIFKNSVHPTIAMDANKPFASFAMDNQLPTKHIFQNQGIPETQALWYASNSFIGYQLCAILAQQWLISKCCLMPAKDATRNGYEITINDGTNVPPEIMDYLRDADVRYKIPKNLIQFVQMGRVFGIRIAMFIVESNDPDYYLKPFNPDGVMPGSYKGVSQIDPYWITPQLDADAAGNPASINFYEPTWWVINGKPVHRTHLIIFRTEEVSDILKPSYIFGGVPIPQKIAQRVFAAESTANEAPMLAATKRTDVIKIDLTKAAANPVGVANRLNQYVETRNNYGVKTIDLDDEFLQFDTSLNDLDAVIMTQYQLVAAAAGVPSVKLLGTSPKGFNTTGEFEEANYHEELESIQEHDLSALLQRHHLLVIRSDVCSEFNIEPFDTAISWNSLDAMTAKELAELNKIKAETGQVLIVSGAIDGQDELDRIINDKESGYNGVESVKNDPEGMEFD